MDDFNFDDDFLDVDIVKEPKNKFARVKRYKRPRTVKYEHAQNMALEIGLLDPEEHIFALVSGNFIAGDFIEAYLIENNLFAEELIIATLSLSQENVDSLRNIQDFDRVDKMGLLVSDYFFSHERKDGIEYIINQLSNSGFFMLGSAGIHTKITLIKTRCGMNLVIGGSANLRSSRNVEQITIDNSQIIYDFNRKWITELLTKYQATHKSLRGNLLWQQVAQAEAEGQTQTKAIAAEKPTQESER